LESIEGVLAMHVTAHLDVDVVALEQDDTLHVLLELQAPPAPASDEPHEPHTIVVVLDRSGSMNGPRLFAAKSALVSLIDRLDPTDRLGVVVFDDQSQVVLPTRRLSEHGKASAKAAVHAIECGGMTDLSSGYLRGLQEAKRAAGESGATIVLLSDGQANAGITDPGSLKKLAGDSRTHGVTTSTIGIGLGYDEQVLVALTEGGQGNHSFAEQAEAAATALAGEVEGLLSKNVQAASLLVKPGPDISTITVLNDLPSTTAPDGVLVELGDFYAQETRRLVLAIEVPGRASLGVAQVAELVFTYVELPALVQHTVSVPLSVNVLPGDEAAGRVRKPEVEREKLLLSVQQAKRDSEEALRAGDPMAAGQIMGAAATMLAAVPMPDDAVLEEIDWFQQSIDHLQDRDTSYNIKRSMASRSARSRGSRDPRRGGEF
jgi:Ca-activated chloride channel family protein